MKLQKFIKVTLATVCFLVLDSCQNDDELSYCDNHFSNTLENLNLDNRNILLIEKDSAIMKFAEILSIAVYNRQDVREFLKKEAKKGLTEIQISYIMK